MFSFRILTRTCRYVLYFTRHPQISCLCWHLSSRHLVCALKHHNVSYFRMAWYFTSPFFLRQVSQLLMPDHAGDAMERMQSHARVRAYPSVASRFSFRNVVILVLYDGPSTSTCDTGFAFQQECKFWRQSISSQCQFSNHVSCSHVVFYYKNELIDWIKTFSWTTGQKRHYWHALQR